MLGICRSEHSARTPFPETLNPDSDLESNCSESGDSKSARPGPVSSTPGKKSQAKDKSDITAGVRKQSEEFRLSFVTYGE
jgi:hypothetical protein